MKKYIYKCKECEGEEPCKLIIKHDIEPDLPMMCPFFGKARWKLKKAREVNK
jgi:hypothetical protein